ncbi:MAG: hypothetical protein QW271_04820 [Sulfolobales archaeon]
MGFDRKYLAIVLAAVALATVANATAFAYRWISGTISVAPAANARGAACTGFYSSAAQSGINLPNAGTNYNAPTYGTNRIIVTTGNVVCSWTYGGNQYVLYESITVNIPITVGSWYIKDFYGFGYNGTTTDPKVYVYLVVEDPITEVTVTEAKLVLMKAGTKVDELDLTTSSGTLGPIELSPGEGLRLDLRLTSVTSSGDASFKVAFYVSQKSEAPW